MFGNEITVIETGIVTLIGMGSVFLVLCLLTLILYLFRFISKEKNTEVYLKTNTGLQENQYQIQDSQISSLYKALIMTAILESIESSDMKHQVRIRNIRHIS